MQSKFHSRYSDHQIINRLKKLIRENKGVPFSASKYKKLNMLPAMTTIHNRFGNYTKAIRLTGYKGHMLGKYNIDSNFFKKINNEAKAYFLGLHITDGNVHSKRNIFTFLIVEQDDHILLELCKRLKTSNKLQYIKNKYKNRQDLVRFERGDRKICEDLKKFGYGPNKTFSVRYPTRKILNKKLDRHLIRGIFDGDGSIMKNGRIDFTSGSRLLLKDISRILNQHLKLNKMVIEERNNNSSSLRLRINAGKNKDQTKKIYKFLYNGSDPKLRLRRKYKTFLNRMRTQSG